MSEIPEGMYLPVKRFEDATDNIQEKYHKDDIDKPGPEPGRPLGKMQGFAMLHPWAFRLCHRQGFRVRYRRG